MDRLDEFAKAALIGLLAGDNSCVVDSEQTATKAYKYAQAMIQERERLDQENLRKAVPRRAE